MPLRVAIFGATSAIAASVARRYAAQGAGLFLAGRSRDKLQALVGELGSAVLGYVEQDFEVLHEAAACVERARVTLGKIDVALIAHGFLADQLQTERDVTAAEQALRVNATSVIALLIPLANTLEAQRHGSIAVMSSVAAERGRPRNYTYAAAKASLNVYLQGLRSRLYPSGVAVHTLKLGPVDTPMTVDHEKNRLFTSPEAAAAQIVRSIERGRSETFIPGRWRFIMPVVRLLPEAVFQRVRGLSGR